MIENDLQYRITKKHLNDFKTSLETLKKRDETEPPDTENDRLLFKAECGGLASMIETLQDKIDVYRKKKKSDYIKIALLTTIICTYLCFALEYLIFTELRAAGLCLVTIVLFFTVERSLKNSKIFLDSWLEAVEDKKSAVQLFTILSTNLEDRINKKDVALKKYGQHVPACSKVLARIGGDKAICNCGFDEAVNEYKRGGLERY